MVVFVSQSYHLTFDLAILWQFLDNIVVANIRSEAHYTHI